jgi:hypothetical protein
MLQPSNRRNLCTANVMLSIGGIPDCFAFDDNFTPYVSHYGLYENNYVIGPVSSSYNFVDSQKGDSVDTDLKCIPWVGSGGKGEVATFTGAQLRLTQSDDCYIMLLRNYRPHMPRKLLDVFSYSTATYDVDIPVQGTRLELKEGDVIVLRDQMEDFYDASRRTAEPLKIDYNWQVFVCLPDLNSFGEGCAHLSKRGVCRQIRERLEAFVETWDVSYDATAKMHVLSCNARRYSDYENLSFPQLVKHTGRVYADGVEPDDDDGVVSLGGGDDDSDVASFAAMTVECGEGCRAKKRALDGGGDEGSSKKPLLSDSVVE